MNESTQPDELSHFDAQGAARMVDVSSKSVTSRRAMATARVRMKPATLQRIRQVDLAKGDVLQIARLAGIQAAKQTAQLIPLCHVVPLSSVEVDFACLDASNEVAICAAVSADHRTGVEMEALTAAAIAALTIYDMCKAIDREISIHELQLVEKTGGKSDFHRS